MIEFYIKISLVFVFSLLGFFYMLYLQKKKQQEADRIFENKMLAIAAKYRQKLKEKKSERSSLQSKAQKD